MASISSLGVGSNLDLNGLLDQLKQAESQPVIALQKRQASYTAKLSGYAKLQGALSALQVAAGRLGDAALYTGVRASSSDTGVLTASAAATAAAGSYSLSVGQLAQAQSLAAAGQASATGAIGSGTVTISWGTITGGMFDSASGTYGGAGFSADASRAPVQIAIDASNNTLQGIRDAINANSQELGLTASIVNDGSGTPWRLVLASSRTGDNASLQISVAGDTALQDLLAHDPAGTQNLQQTTAAQNARLTVNGVAITSATNSVSGAVDGLTLNLLKAGASQVNVQRDTASVSSAINDFVGAYNALQATIVQQTAYNADTKTAAPLVGDATLRLIQSRIRNLHNTPQGGGAQVLSNIGVSFQKDGTLQVDASKLGTALSGNLAGVAGLFAGGAGGGLGRQLSSLVAGYTQADGTMDIVSQGVKTTLKSLAERISATQDKVDARIAVYRAQFTQLDRMMSQMNATSSYLTQQFTAMTSTKK